MDMTSNFTRGDEAAALCEAAPAATRGECYYGIGGVMGRFSATAAAREADCRELTTNARHLARCVAGTKIKGPLSVALAR